MLGIRKTTLLLVALALLSVGAAQSASYSGPALVVGSTHWTDAKLGINRFNATTGAAVDQNFYVARTEGVAYGPDGDIYVADANGAVRRFDGTTLASKGFFTNTAERYLVGSGGLAFGPDGNLYVVAGEQNAVAKFNGTTGAYIGEFVARNDALAPGLRGLSFGPDGNLYVSTDEGTNSRVIKYDGSTGALIGNFVTAGSGGLYFGRDMAWGADGNLYVSSYNDGRIKKYNGATGAFISNFAGNDGTLVNPYGLRFGPDGSLYVADLGRCIISKYDGTTGAHQAYLVDRSWFDLALPTYIAFSPTPVPEPGSLLALGTGLMGLAGFVIRRRK